mgnify:CR=1 FL=1
MNRKGIKIGKDCWIGSKTTILDGTEIGDGCIIAAGAVVRGKIESYSIIGGIPAKTIKKKVMKHIICFHLFNDYSGSPKVLKIVLEGLLKKGYQIDLITSTGGALDELLYYKNLSKYSYPYRFQITR